MTIISNKKNGVLHITLRQRVKGVWYEQSYICSFAEAEKTFKQYLRERTGEQNV